jgi:hypothetical protein
MEQNTNGRMPISAVNSAGDRMLMSGPGPAPAGSLERRQPEGDSKAEHQAQAGALARASVGFGNHRVAEHGEQGAGREAWTNAPTAAGSAPTTP